MNKLRIASALAAFTSVLALPALGAGSNDPPNSAANLDAKVPANATQPAAPAPDGATGTTNAAGAAHANPQKHPPTAAMDSATPTEKTPDSASAMKHAPTNQMDNAAPDQKSLPASPADAASSGSRIPTSQLPK